MEGKRFYVTIEVTAQMRGDMDKWELRGRILDYIRNENRKKNHVNAICYVHGENVMSVYDEKGEEL